MAGDGGKPDAGSSAGPGADSYVAMVERLTQERREYLAAFPGLNEAITKTIA